MTITDDPTGTIDPRWARVRPMVFRTIIGAVVAAGLVGIVAVLLGDFGRVAVQLLLTVVVVVVFALLSWYDADVSSRRSGTFAFASIVVSMYLLVTGLFKVWVVPTDPYGGDGIWLVGEHFWQWLGIVFVARFALLHVHLLLVIHRRYPTPLLQLVAKVTVGVIALLALLLSVPLLAPDADLASGYWRLVWVVVILDLLGTVVVPLSNALFRPRHHGGPGAGASVDAPSVAWRSQLAAATPVAGGWTGTPVPAAPAVSAAPAVPAGPAVAAAPAVSVDPTALAADGRRTHDEAATVRGSDGLLYERRPDGALALAWPRYVDGTPLPAAPDGSPDFGGVARP
ncbi:hypothetical protein [Curtobacterium sp. ME26]|uniref:hypothetical protein n=1 Tax=Curtobacterium sp. ME26 TaxID=2744254 RepID=UPI0015F51D3F|nr:hypothetical protein [Curtobacterium sp. ME26]